MQKVLIFSAPSGSGKTTLVHYILQQSAAFAFSISATTRQPRGTEKHGQDYYFLTIDEFRQKIDNEDFVEWEEVYEGKFYGTLKSEVERIWAAGKIVVFDVDVQGGIRLKKYFGERALSIFIMPPSLEELEKRLLGRGTDDADTIQTRLAKAENEIFFQKNFDRILINADLDQAKEELTKLVTDFIKK